MGLLGETGRISIHAPRTGSDKNSYDFIYNFNLFQSTLPARGATTISIVPSLFDLISIHAPRTGSDIQAHRIAALVAAISIHAPRTGSDMRRILMRTLFFWNFNPRSPHGERRPCAVQVRVAVFISIHAPRTGSDTLSRPPAFRNTISIHAPRTGSDTLSRPPAFRNTISIHAPRTGSDTLSRPPAFRNTISIHAPRTGSDHYRRQGASSLCHFNPRSPHGERPYAVTHTPH